MAITYFPFNSTIVNGKPDRAANAEILALYLKTFFTDGVVLNRSDALQVYAKEGMTVQVKPGVSFLDGRIMCNDTNYDLELETAHASLNRIDRLVFRLDYVQRLMELDILVGEPATNPVGKELTRAADIYEMCLAEIAVNATYTEITQAQISDTRASNEVCGLVAAAIKQIETSTFYEQYTAQFEQLYNLATTNLDEFMQESQTAFNNWLSTNDAQFKAWFEEVKDLVDQNTLAGVSAEIDALKTRATNLENRTLNLEDETLTFANVQVSAAAFTADTTYANYPFKAEITLAGVTAAYSPSTRYSMETKEAGIGMVEECIDGKLVIYAESVPAADFVIPAVICEEVSV